MPHSSSLLHCATLKSSIHKIDIHSDHHQSYNTPIELILCNAHYVFCFSCKPLRPCSTLSKVIVILASFCILLLKIHLYKCGATKKKQSLGCMYQFRCFFSLSVYTAYFIITSRYHVQNTMFGIKPMESFLAHLHIIMVLFENNKNKSRTYPQYIFFLGDK